MSELVTIEAVERFLTEDSKIPAIRGEIRWVGEVKTGTSTKGPTKGQEWSMQSFLLVDPDKEKDDDYSSIFCALSGCDEFDLNYKGKDIVIASTDGKKGLSGVKVSEYKKKKQITVTRTGKIMLYEDYVQMNGSKPEAESGSPPESEPEKDEPKKEARSEKEPEKPKTEKEQNYVNNVNGIKRQLFRMKGIYNLCMDAAAVLAEDIHGRHGYMYSPVFIEKWATNMFHKMMHDGSGALMINSDEFPIDNYKVLEFKGNPIKELLPSLIDSVDQTRAHNITQEAIVKKTIEDQLNPKESKEPEQKQPEEEPESEDERSPFDPEEDIEEDVPF